MGSAHRRAVRGRRRAARGTAHPRQEAAGGASLNAERAPVILVHGLWLNGLEFFLLRDRLAAANYAPVTLHYSSMHASLGEAAAKLSECLRAQAGPAHVVAHSLGGIVALESLGREAGLPPGRVVLLGSPVQGSRSARAISRWHFGPQILGPIGDAGLCRPCDRRAPPGREIGVIAGSLSVGLGRAVAELPLPNDGTVCADETRLPGSTAEILLHVSHTGMLISRAVASSVVRFLQCGAF